MKPHTQQLPEITYSEEMEKFVRGLTVRVFLGEKSHAVAAHEIMVKFEKELESARKEAVKDFYLHRKKPIKGQTEIENAEDRGYNQACDDLLKLKVALFLPTSETKGQGD